MHGERAKCQPITKLCKSSASEVPSRASPALEAERALHIWKSKRGAKCDTYSLYADTSKVCLKWKLSSMCLTSHHPNFGEARAADAP